MSMIRRIFVCTVALGMGLAHGQAIDLAKLTGKDWYGLYFNGQKMGYAVSELTIGADGAVTLVDIAEIKILMANVRQEMHIQETRIYGPDGALRSIESAMELPGGPQQFSGQVRDGALHFASIIGGSQNEETLPIPADTLQDKLDQVLLVRHNPKIGDSVEYTLFEPFYKKELHGTSTIVGVEERVFEGVPATLYKVRSIDDVQQVEAISYMTGEGQVVEDVIAGNFVMRLESEEMAKDGGYVNDTIISNAVFLETPLRNPRELPLLKLRIGGPLKNEDLFSDARQSILRDGDTFVFEARKPDFKNYTGPKLPVEDASVAEWRAASSFIQSDDERLISKAKEIIGDETDAFKAASLLSEWVHDHMRSTFRATLSNSLEVLDQMDGDCTEHSVLFIGLARAAGIPAREVAGLIYVGTGRPGFYFHQWATVWVGQWIEVDPTFGQVGVDVTHIKLAEGDLLNQTRLIPIIGHLEIEVLEDDAS